MAAKDNSSENERILRDKYNIERTNSNNLNDFFRWIKHKAGNGWKGRNPSQQDNYNAFIFVTILWYIFKILMTRWSVAYDIIFLAVIAFFFLNEEDKTRHKVILGIVIVWDIFMPVFGPKYFRSFFNSNAFLKYYLSNVFVVPAWFFYALIRAKSRTRLSKFLTIFVIFLWLGFILASVPGVFSESETSIVKPGQIGKMRKVIEKSKSFYKGIGERIWAGIRGVNETWERQKRMAMGDYYTGEVEENEHKELGIYLEEIKAANTEFYRDDIVSVWANLKARTMDDSITIKTECYNGEKKNGIADVKGKIYPKEIFNVYNDEDEQIDCEFPRYSLKKGSQKITIEANFNFETLGYLKLYFMQRDKIRALKSQGKDPLDFYEIEDKEPEAKYTNGPIMLGIGSDGHLIGVSNSYTNRISLGITLDNEEGYEEDQGYIKNIGSLIVEIPDSLELDKGSCNYHFSDYTKEECIKDNMNKNSRILFKCAREENIDPEELFEKAKEEDSGKIKEEYKEVLRGCIESECEREFKGYNLYKLNESRKKKSLENIKEFITFRCRIKIKDINKLLDNTPIATRYIRVKTKYNYSLKKHIYVEIKDTSEETNREFKKNVPTEPEKNIVWVYNTYKQEIDKSGLDKCFFTALIHEESNGNPESEENGCIGLIHFCPDLADEYGLCKEKCYDTDNRQDKDKNIDATARFFNDFFSKHSNLKEDDKYYIALAGLKIGKDVVEDIIKNTKKEKDIEWTDVNAKITADNLKKYEKYKEMGNENIENIIAGLNKAKGIIMRMKKECEDKKITNKIEKKEDSGFEEKEIYSANIEKGKEENKDIAEYGISVDIKNGYDEYTGNNINIVIKDSKGKEAVSERIDEDETKENYEEIFDDLPFVKLIVKFGQEHNAEVKISAISDGTKTITLEKGIEKELVKDWAYAEYTGNSIIIKVKKGDDEESVCNIDWDNSYMAICKNHVPGEIKILNIEPLYNVMHDNEIKVRIEYKNARSGNDEEKENKDEEKTEEDKTKDSNNDDGATKEEDEETDYTNTDWGGLA